LSLSPRQQILPLRAQSKELGFHKITISLTL
jgi:hypothetical protein